MSPAAKQSSPSLVFPGTLSLVSLSLMVHGFFGESWWIGLGFVLLVTSALAGLFSYGAATSVMTVAVVPVGESATSAQADTEFFPKGAIAFFAAMILFFGATWLGLYGLMIYRGSNL